MTNHKKPKKSKKIKERIGSSLSPAVSADLILQQVETSNTIKNYDTAGIPYDKKVYDKYIRNIEAQKVASKYDDQNLNIKLANRGDLLFKDLKKSLGQPTAYTGEAISYVMPQQPQQQQAPQQPEVTAELINTAERKILNLVSSTAYRKGKRPNQKTIARWAKSHANNDKAFVISVLNRHFSAVDTNTASKIIKQENVNYASAKTQLKRLKLKKELDAKTSSSTPPPKTPVKKISSIAKNKLIDEKFKNYPDTPTSSVIKRFLTLKKIKDSNITIDDVNKRFKKTKKK